MFQRSGVTVENPTTRWSHDVVGAHNCGIDVLGVYYGFAKSGELEDAGADYIVSKVEEIVKIITG